MRQHLIDRARDLTDAQAIERLADPAGMGRLLADLELDAPVTDEREDRDRWDEAFEGRN